VFFFKFHFSMVVLTAVVGHGVLGPRVGYFVGVSVGTGADVVGTGEAAIGAGVVGSTTEESYAVSCVFMHPWMP
jgi:hypothetical protein